jgi:hypothetical protein
MMHGHKSIKFPILFILCILNVTTAFFWDSKKRRLLVCYRRCVQRIGPILKGWRVHPERSVRNYNYTLQKSQKSADLIYTATES